MSCLMGAAPTCVQAAVAAPGYLPVNGGPSYTAGAGGVRGGSVSGGGVGGGGTSVGYADKYDASGAYFGTRAVRWGPGGTTELGHLGTTSGGATSAQAYAVNATGTAVGYAYKYNSGGGSRAVRWNASGTVATELPTLGTNPRGNWSDAEAYAINDAGTAVGFSEKYEAGRSYGYRAVRWDPSGTAVTELGHIGLSSDGWTTARATAVNDVGTAVGWARKYELAEGGMRVVGTRAVRWDGAGTAASEFGALGVDAFGQTEAQALAVNAAGTTVGYSFAYTETGASRGYRAVRWDASGTVATELGHLGTAATGFTTGKAFAINAAGTAVGFSEKFEPFTRTSLGNRPVRWVASGTSARELGNLGTDVNDATDGQAYAINDAGVTVGYLNAYSKSGTLLGQRAVAWGADGAAIDLNWLIDPTSGWTLTQTKAISDTGYMAGVGTFDPDGPGGQAGYARLFSLYIPAAAVPEPSTLALLLGVTGLSLRRGQRRARSRRQDEQQDGRPVASQDESSANRTATKFT